MQWISDLEQAPLRKIILMKDRFLSRGVADNFNQKFCLIVVTGAAVGRAQESPFLQVEANAARMSKEKGWSLSRRSAI